MDLSFVTRKLQRSMAGLSLLAILASFAGFTGTAFAKSFSDVTSSSFAYTQIGALSDAGIMTGEGDGSMFVPAGNLTREEAAKVLVEAFVGSVDTTYNAGFSDVVSGQWYTSYVNTGALYGIFSGNPDGSFGVGKNINRADFAKMVVSAAGLDSDGTMGSDMFNDVPSSSYYNTYVGTAWAYSVLDGTSSTTYSPANSVTREQAAKMVYNAMNPVYRGTGGTTTTSNATLQVSVSKDTPAADTLPSNATSVPLASFDFKANGDSASIDGLTVHQYGISSVPSGALVYLYEGSDRLTTGTTVNSTTHESQFRNLNVDISKGDTVTLTVRMDLGCWSTTSPCSGPGTGEVGFEIASADMIDTNSADVSGDFPAQGDKFSVSTTSVGTVSIDKNGNVDNADVGEDDAYVAKLKLTANSTEGGYLKELGLYTAGTVSTADVENFRLYVTGDDAEPIAQVDNVDNLDVVRFVIGEGSGVMDGMSDGYLIDKGNSKSFYVLADFNTGRTGDTVEMYVDQDTDVVMTGNLYGYGMQVNRESTDSPAGTYDGSSCTSTSGNCTYQTLQGGDITVSSNGPAATDIGINSKDVQLLKFVVTSVTDATFDNFPILLTASESADTTEGLLSTSTANFTDIKIVDTDSGEQLYSSVDSTALITTEATSGTAIAESGDTTGYYVWTDDWAVTAGSEYNLALETDVANTSTLDGMTLVGALPFSSTFPALKDSNNKTLTNSSVLVPNSTISGKTMTVRSPSLTVSLASTPSSGQSFVKGKQDVQYTGIVFACGQASDCKVTDLTLQGYYDSNGGADSFVTTGALSSAVGSVALMDGDGNTVAASKSVNSSTSVVQYTNMNWTIGAGDTEIVYVTGDLSSDATTSADVAFGIAAASDITVENSDGNSFSATGTLNAPPTTTTGTYVAISAGGTLTVATSSEPAENIVVAGSSSVSISKFKLTSTKEAFSVSKLSLNNRQSAVTSTTTLGDNDNNVASVSISYTNEAGSTETKTGYLVSGTAEFSGLDLYVPADSSATVSVMATLNPISSGGSSATAGEFVDLAMAFDTFEALAADSGSTYTAGNLDAGSANLSIGTITWADTGYDTNGVVASSDPGTSQTLAIDTGTTVFPVGTLLCIGAGTTTCAGTDSQFVTTATWSTTAPTVRVVDNADVSIADGLNVMYALPGTGYFTGTNQMVVYESKPTVALASSSPSGSRTVNSSDNAFDFTVTTSAVSGDKEVVINPAVDFSTCLAGAGTPGVSQVTAVSVDGSACAVANAGTNGDSIAYANTANLTPSNYAYVSFWINAEDASSGAITDFDPTDLSVCTSTTQAADDQCTVVAASNVIGSPSLFTTGQGAAGAWYQVRDVAMPSATDTGDLFLAIKLHSAGADSLVDGDTIWVDQVKAYSQRLEVDMASDAAFDRLYNDSATSAKAPVVAYLKDGGTTLATGYVDMVTVDTAANGVEDGTNASSATIQFVPTSTQGEIDVTSATSRTFSVVLDTGELLVTTDNVDDPLTFSVDLGSSIGGTVAAGDFWWSDTNATVKWLGDVSSSTLVGNTVNY